MLNMSCRPEACTPASQMQRGLTPEQDNCTLPARLCHRQREDLRVCYICPAAQKPARLHPRCREDSHQSKTTAHCLHASVTDRERTHVLTQYML